MKFSIESPTSYGSIHHASLEPPANNIGNNHDGTEWFGILLAFLSGIFFTISSGMVKAVKNVDPMVLLGIRAVFQMIVMMAFAIRNQHNLAGPKGSRMFLHFQGIVGGITLALLYYSFRELPLGDATTIIFSSPVIVIVLSFFVLKEPCGSLRVMVVGGLFAGVILVSKPPFLFKVHEQDHHHYDSTGYVCAIFAAIFTAMNIVVMRKCSKVHFSVLVFNLSCWILLSAVFFFSLKSDALQCIQTLSLNYHTWVLIFLVALTGLTGQVLVAKALKIEGAGKVSVTRTLDIILAYLIQVHFFGEVPNSSSIIGATFILGSVLAMGFEREIYRICSSIPQLFAR